MEHVEWVTSVLQSASFHAEYVALRIPLPIGNDTYMRLNINRSTTQITADVCQNGVVVYCGVFAIDMVRPMCPVFKH